jgi:hypothetical protein
MKILEILEILDSTPKFEVGIQTRTKFGTKTHIGGAEYVFIASVDDDWIWNIAFGDMENGERRTRLSGKGNEFEVLAFVRASFQEFLKHYNPIFISFTADSETRQKIYTRMFSRLMPDWKHTVEDAGKAGLRYTYSRDRKKK